MGEILKMTAFLVLVCAVSAVALSFTDAQTKPLIDKHKKEVEEAARKAVLPDAATFEALQGAPDGFYTGIGADGNPLGYVGKSESKGFGGKVIVMAGVGLDGKVTGVKILEHTETPGLGTNAVDPEKPVIKSMIGKSGAEVGLKKDGPPGQVDAITGVTITSRAVSDGVKNVLAGLKDVLPQAGD